MNSDKFPKNANLKGWGYTIMKNSFINNHRLNMKTKNTFDSAKNDFNQKFHEDKGNPSPKFKCCTKEIINCFNTLNAEFKVPFYLFLEGFKYIEIAEELNLPLRTVKSRIFLTRQKLGELLKDYIS
jgi:RNA polymerase sigma-70 factor (ECF subfamily)